MVPYPAVSSRARILVASLLALQLTGCAEERVFDLRIQPPSVTCPPLGDLSDYVVLTWEGNQFVGCRHGPCPIGAELPEACLAGVETPAIEAGNGIRVEAMIFGPPPGEIPVLCGNAGTQVADLNLPKLDIRLECADSCPNEQPCKPIDCANDQKAFCPEFRR